jgi:hypothetical protein
MRIGWEVAGTVGVSMKRQTQKKQKLVRARVRAKIMRETIAKTGSRSLDKV